MTDPAPSTPRTGCGCPDFRMSRRRLLGTSVAAGGGLAAVQLFGDAYRQASFAGEPGGNVVVVLSLRGGADGLSMIVPRGADHALLRGYRPDIAVPESTLLGSDPRFGLHPELAPLLPMWEAKTFGAVHAVGQPAPNRSHFEAMEEVEEAAPGSSARTGWINRVTGLSASASPVDAVSLGTPLLPTSMAGPAPGLGAGRVADLTVAGLGTSEARRQASLATMWSDTRTVLADGVHAAARAATQLSGLVAGVDDEVHVDRYPQGPLAEVLADTAALIRADVGTSMIAVDYGDWDMHEGLGSVDGGWMHDHLGHLAGALAAFFTDLGAHASRVTLVTISEFGRRVEQNGSGGVDHGYGNAMLLLGGGVAGGTVHGDWPGLAQLADGDLAVRQDFRDVVWEVLTRRFDGVGQQRAQVFPGYTPRTLGAMR